MHVFSINLLCIQRTVANFVLSAHYYFMNRTQGVQERKKGKKKQNTDFLSLKCQLFGGTAEKQLSSVIDSHDILKVRHLKKKTLIFAYTAISVAQTQRSLETF